MDSLHSMDVFCEEKQGAKKFPGNIEPKAPTQKAKHAKQKAESLGKSGTPGPLHTRSDTASAPPLASSTARHDRDFPHSPRRLAHARATGQQRHAEEGAASTARAGPEERGVLARAGTGSSCLSTGYEEKKISSGHNVHPSVFREPR